MSRRHWVGTVSKQHVEVGKEYGFAQVCHGKKAPLQRMQGGDVLIYYSSNLAYGDKTAYQCFTAIGVVSVDGPYQVKMSEDFEPYRRDVKYYVTQDAPIKPMISRLAFIQDKKRWGYVFRFGINQIGQQDFRIIAEAMQLEDAIIHDLLI